MLEELPEAPADVAQGLCEGSETCPKLPEAGSDASEGRRDQLTDPQAELAEADSGLEPGRDYAYAEEN